MASVIIVFVKTYYGFNNYGGRSNSMNAKIQPEYNMAKVTCSTCGEEFELGSTVKEIRVDTCSKCHPFYTGQQTFVQAQGRVERFNRRYGIKNEQQTEEK